MVIEIKDDILTVKEGVIVHGVNCQAVMNSGVAQSIRKMYPSVYREYLLFVEKNNGNTLGKINVVQINEDLFIVNLFSQMYYGKDKRKYANICAIEQGLMSLLEDVKLKEINITKIGCGLGGLNWKTEVKPLFEKLANQYDCLFKVFSL